MIISRVIVIVIPNFKVQLRYSMTMAINSHDFFFTGDEVSGQL